MIENLQEKRLTADQAARRLVMEFGEQLQGMENGGEWGWVVDPEKLTAKETVEIRRLCEKHLLRIRKFLNL